MNKENELNDKNPLSENISEKKSNEEVEQSNLILNAMFNAMPDSVFCKDLEKRYIECNKSFEKFIAHSKDEIIGKTFAELAGREVDIVKFYEDVDSTVINESKPIVQEDVVLTYNGVDRLYDLIKAPLIKKNDNGEDEIIGLLGIMHDVNERYNLIKDLQNTQADLESTLERANTADRVKNDFLSRMSHELLTPMNAIMGMSQIAQSSADLNYIKKCIDEIFENSSHLLRLINNLLEVSNGAGDLSESVFSIGILGKNAKERMARHFPAKHQTLTVEMDKSLPKEMVADIKRIDKVIYHLLSNASKFSKNNSEILLKFKLLSDASDRQFLEVSVTDSGIGIPAETLNTIFEIFEQGDGSYNRKYQGVGIGLTLSKYNVEMMGGTISVDSGIGKGSTFKFTVPINRR